VENTGSRPLSHSQATNRRISSWVGDDQRIPAETAYSITKYTNEPLAVHYPTKASRLLDSQGACLD
jgi:hypothetical protein